MTINVGDLISFLSVAMAAFAGLYTFIVSQGKAAAPEIEKLRAEIELLRNENSVLAGRVTKVEGDVQHLPTKDALHEVEKELAAQGQLMKRVDIAVSRIESWLDQVKSAQPPPPQQAPTFVVTPQAPRRRK